MRALVAFHNHTVARYTKLLRPGFRHCFVCVLDGDRWILIDQVHGVVRVRLAAQGGDDLAAWYRVRNFTIVETETAPKALRLPVGMTNCVGVVKSVLGLRSWAFTPWQLYRRLIWAER